MDYTEAIQKIKNLEKFGSNLGLERMERLMSIAGNPQDNINCIHVAGTNGKGSVCFSLESILRSAGYKVGIYTSPSICEFRERIMVNGKKISESELTKSVKFFEPLLENRYFKNNPVTEFELTTAIAFKFFYDEKCDIVILETGLGGRLDATNIIKKPICSVLTSISFDHTHILGDTLEKICSEKCGIIKSKCPVVVNNNQDQIIYNTINDYCKNTDSKVFLSNSEEIKEFNIKIPYGITFKYNNINVECPSLGEYQKVNFACTLKVLETISSEFPVTNDAIKYGFKNLKLPYRLQIIKQNPLIILDAAHNPAGTIALANFIEKNLKSKNIIGVVGMFKDKDYETSLGNVLKLFKTVYTISPNSPRALDLQEITYAAGKYCNNVLPCESLKYAINKAISSADENTAIIIFGSFSVMQEFENSKL